MLIVSSGERTLLKLNSIPKDGILLNFTKSHMIVVLMYQLLTIKNINTINSVIKMIKNKMEDIQFNDISIKLDKHYLNIQFNKVVLHSTHYHYESNDDSIETIFLRVMSSIGNPKYPISITSKKYYK